VTRDAHETVDASFGRFDLGDPADYRAFLTAHAAIVPALEAWLDAHRPAELSGWQAVRRGPALLADLAALGQPAPPSVAITLPADTASVCGATYVLEGSRMGGALLSRRVAADLPSTYLGAPSQVALWRGFFADLDHLLPDAAAVDRAGEAALATFVLFRTAGATEV
jgi:heme oxygenase